MTVFVLDADDLVEAAGEGLELDLLVIELEDEGPLVRRRGSACLE